MKHLGDITKINGAEIEPVDVITGGSPCQDLSIAGKRAGLAGARSGLFMEQIRIVKEMRQESERANQPVRPRYMVWENVPGAFSSNGGRDFAAVLEEIIKIVEPETPSIEAPEKGWPTWGGYHDEVGGRWSVAWRVHDAQYWGVAQRRRRIAVIADFGGDTAGEILFERKSVSGYSAPSGEAGERLASLAENGIAQSSSTFCIQGNCIDRADTAGCNGKGWTEDVSYTLNTIDRHAVYDRGNGDGKIACTITGDHQSRVTDYTAVVCSQVAYDSYTEADTTSTLKSSGGSYGGGTWNMTIDSFMQVSEEKSATLKASDYKDPQCVCNAYTVRRLTPLECERLQGFPDGWTDIGEWRDSKGKLHKPSDTPRYKALGNSIALPFWDFLAKRISAQYLHPITMGSLFDGIGGFPLVFEKYNGKGAARWASEIEEFPIAVTKRHFEED